MAVIQTVVALHQRHRCGATHTSTQLDSTHTPTVPEAGMDQVITRDRRDCCFAQRSVWVCRHSLDCASCRAADAELRTVECRGRSTVQSLECDVLKGPFEGNTGFLHHLLKLHVVSHVLCRITPLFARLSIVLACNHCIEELR